MGSQINQSFCLESLGGAALRKDGLLSLVLITETEERRDPAHGLDAGHAHRDRVQGVRDGGFSPPKVVTDVP